jgi:hypothetical protein
MNKNTYFLNMEGTVREIYTVGTEFDKVYLSIAEVEKPVIISIAELSALVEDLRSVVYSISSAAKLALIDKTINTADLLTKLLEEADEESDSSEKE